MLAGADGSGRGSHPIGRRPHSHLVRERGLEPPPLAGPDPKSGVSAISPLARSPFDPPAPTIPARPRNHHRHLAAEPGNRRRSAPRGACDHNHRLHRRARSAQAADGIVHGGPWLSQLLPGAGRDRRPRPAGAGAVSTRGALAFAKSPERALVSRGLYAQRPGTGRALFWWWVRRVVGRAAPRFS